MLTFGSLFAGIGGFDLGLERAGMKCEWQVEIDEHCSKQLAKHWPDVERFADVRECGKHNLRAVDVICGGFPCQDVSVAGKRKGLAGKRSGLWTEFHRIVREIEPKWVLVENVDGILSSNSGRDFGRVLGDLARCRYHATWRVLQANWFGAPHRRRRMFLIANRDSERVKGFWQKEIQRVAAFSWCKDVRGLTDLRGRPDIPEPLVRRAGDGLSARVDRIGNAVMPQIAEWLGKRIMELDNLPYHSAPTLARAQFIGGKQPKIGESVAVGAENDAIANRISTTI